MQVAFSTCKNVSGRVSLLLKAERGDSGCATRYKSEALIRVPFQRA